MKKSQWCHIFKNGGSNCFLSLYHQLCRLSPMASVTLAWAPGNWWFLSALGEEKTYFFQEETIFMNFALAILALYLRRKSFNEDRNHHQYIIGTALMYVV
jgi:hypothetical protein